MMLGLSMGLAGGRTGSGGQLTPVYTNFWQNSSGDPTLTGSVAGRLLVATAARTSATPATIASGWTLWGAEGHATASQSLAFYWKAAAGSDTVAWTNAVGIRGVWEFKDAVIDTLNFSQAASTATLNYEEQVGMAANCLVGVHTIISAAQTSATAATAGLGYTTRASKTASLSTYMGDSNTTLVSSFDPANGTFDASGNWTMGVFTVKGAG